MDRRTVLTSAASLALGATAAHAQHCPASACTVAAGAAVHRTFTRLRTNAPHAPMPTPRHAVGAVTIGDWIYVAGGGAVTGGAVQSAVHEAFTLG